MITREPIYSALFAKFAALPGFVTVSRRLKHFTEVDKAQMPALYQTQLRETPQVTRGLPTKYNLQAELTVYVNQSNLTDSITPILNPLLDAIELALKPDDVTATECTLGGKVSHCRIDGGAIEIYEGVNDGTLTVAIIPISIMVS